MPSEADFKSMLDSCARLVEEKDRTIRNYRLSVVALSLLIAVLLWFRSV